MDHHTLGFGSAPLIASLTRLTRPLIFSRMSFLELNRTLTKQIILCLFIGFALWWVITPEQLFYYRVDGNSFKPSGGYLLRETLSCLGRLSPCPHEGIHETLMDYFESFAPKPSLDSSVVASASSLASPPSSLTSPSTLPSVPSGLYCIATSLALSYLVSVAFGYMGLSQCD